MLMFALGETFFSFFFAQRHRIFFFLSFPLVTTVIQFFKREYVMKAISQGVSTTNIPINVYRVLQNVLKLKIGFLRQKNSNNSGYSPKSHMKYSPFEKYREKKLVY